MINLAQSETKTSGRAAIVEVPGRVSDAQGRPKYPIPERRSKE